jgi:uncharacterized damage-inducible protein DinB
MRRVVLGGITLLAALCLLPARLAAQGAPPATGFKAEVSRSIEDAEKKVIALAEKFPAEKYSWHPEGARSTGEAFMHIVSGNYGYAAFMGTPRPEGITRESLAKITEKPQIIEALKKSFAHLKMAIANVSDMEKSVKLFGGREGTVREVMLLAATHDHEHMGQLIAYARVNGIVPPWSEEQARPAAPSKPGN